MRRAGDPDPAGDPSPSDNVTSAVTTVDARADLRTTVTRDGDGPALGIHLGCYAHVLAAAVGLSAVFRHVPELYAAVKIVGLGLQRSKSRNQRCEMPAKRRLVDLGRNATEETTSAGASC